MKAIANNKWKDGDEHRRRGEWRGVKLGNEEEDNERDLDQPAIDFFSFIGC